MTFVFLGLLALAWIAVFLPAVVRARATAPLSTAERFKRRMNLLAPRARAGRWIVVPESYDRLRNASFRRAQRRRKQILIALLFAAGLTFLAALASGGAAWEVNLAFDAMLGLYVVVLREAKKRRTEQGAKVRRIERRAAEPSTAAIADEDIFHEPVKAVADR